MTLSEELTWRGFVNQMTFADISELDKENLTFYWGVDPSASSMTVGNLAAAMMVRTFMEHGYKPVLLVGGATGMIGDPDGKNQERELLTPEQITKNKTAITAQYQQVFDGQRFTVVDNYDWFKDLGYLEFLRSIGKHMSMTQMLDRDFVKSRIGKGGSGISYAEFSYSLIQGYDFLHLYREHGVTLQLCGADQWGNSTTGVTLIRKLESAAAHVYSTPLIVNKSTGVKFGKSEAGAVWLDPNMTTPTEFYQFWINIDDDGVEDYLKIFTRLDRETISDTVKNHRNNPGHRYGQRVLAHHVTAIVHGQEAAGLAEEITDILSFRTKLEVANNRALIAMQSETKFLKTGSSRSVVDILVDAKLASSRAEAKRLIDSKSIYLNGSKFPNPTIENDNFINGYALIRRGKAFKDSALLKLEEG